MANFIWKSVIYITISLNYYTKQFMILNIWKWSNIYIYSIADLTFYFYSSSQRHIFFLNLFEIKLWYFKCVSYRPYSQYLPLVYIILNNFFERTLKLYIHPCNISSVFILLYNLLYSEMFYFAKIIIKTLLKITCTCTIKICTSI